MLNENDSSKIRCTASIAALPAKVWEALTSTAFTQQYWAGRHIVSTWKPGASVQMLKADGHVEWEGEIVKAAAPRLLTYTFLVPRVEPGATEPESLVTFELIPVSIATEVSLTHEGFPPDSANFRCMSKAWPAILGNLRNLLETGKTSELSAWEALQVS